MPYTQSNPVCDLPTDSSYRSLLERNIIRAEWRRLVEMQAWDVVATLTFAYPVFDLHRVGKYFLRWLRSWIQVTAEQRGQLTRSRRERADGTIFERLTGPVGGPIRRGRPSTKATYIAFPEQQPGIGWHLHAMIRSPELIPNLDPALGKRLWKGSQSENGLALGYEIDIGALRDLKAAATYNSKQSPHGNVLVSDNFMFTSS